MTTKTKNTPQDGNRQADQFQEGDFIYASWGYNQTNIDFAKIVDVSDTRKTVVCRMVSSRRLEGGSKTSENKMPEDEPYGDKFRLHVRERNGDVYFRGSYPHCTGEKADGTRLDNLYKWDKTSISETRPNMGH